MVLSRPPAGGFTISTYHSGRRVVVTLAGRLGLDAVEDLAACADGICRGAVPAGARRTVQATGGRDAVRVVTFDVAAVDSVDDAGARTLAAACRCLAWHGVSAGVRGLSNEMREVIGRLGLRLPETAQRARANPSAAAQPPGARTTPATRPVAAPAGL